VPRWRGLGGNGRCWFGTAVAVDPEALGDLLELAVLVDQRTEFAHAVGDPLLQASEIVKDRHSGSFEQGLSVPFITSTALSVAASQRQVCLHMREFVDR
jgi:hypothetical protein